jgi:hypothetical protein
MSELQYSVIKYLKIKCKQLSCLINKLYTHVRFQVLTAMIVKFTVFWNVATFSQVDFDRRLRSASSKLHIRRRENMTFHVVNFYGLAILRYIFFFHLSP